MSAFVELYRSQLLIFLFVLTRVSGLVFAAPPFAVRHAPAQVRVLLALAVAVLVAPVFWHADAIASNDALSVLLSLCREAVLGLVLGLALLILVAGLHGAGQIVGQMSGMSLAVGNDPGSQMGGSLFGRLFDLVAIVVFLLIGGHRQVLAALLDTFNWMPPGEVALSTGLVPTLSEVISQSFLLALRTSAPVVVALLLASLILGFISRTVPQLNLLAVGFSLNVLIVVAVLSVCIGGVAWTFQQQTEETLAALQSVMTSIGPSGP